MVNVDELSGFPKILLTDIVPALGCLLAFAVFVAPLVVVLRARRIGNLGEINPVPYPCVVGNTIAWIAYGCATSDQYVLWANLPGLFLGGFYCLSAYALTFKRDYEVRLHGRAITAKSVDFISNQQGQKRCDATPEATVNTGSVDMFVATTVIAQVSSPACPPKSVIVATPRATLQERLTSQLFQMELLMIVAIGANAMAIYVSCFYLDLDTAKTVLGVVANFMVTSLYVSPLATMAKVLRTRDAESIDPRLAAAQFCNCVLWSIYGIVLNDPLIYAVNLFGIGTAIAQFAMLILFGSWSWSGRRGEKATSGSYCESNAANGDAVSAGVESAEADQDIPCKGKAEAIRPHENVVDV